MKTVEKLYWKDAYVKEFDAAVTGAEGRNVFLDRTAFHPQGGGLPGDSGHIGDLRVEDTIKEGEQEIVHVIEGTSHLEKDSEVHCAIDWPRRYRIMKMHTAAHALSAVFHREAGALITGNQIRQDESRIDFSLENMNREEILGYIEIVNDELKRDLPVRTYFLPREEALKIPGVIKLASTSPPNVENFRIVEIEGLDIQADGGVHVRRLGEIGRIEVTRLENKGKQNRRLYFRVAD